MKKIAQANGTKGVTLLGTGLGPTLAQAYELNGWSISRCQPGYRSTTAPTISVRLGTGERIFLDFMGLIADERTNPIWHIGGIGEPVGVHWSENGLGKSGFYQLKVAIPPKVRKELGRAKQSGLFTNYGRIGRPDGAFIAISTDPRVFKVSVKRDPIILGFGRDGQWHVIAAFNLKLDLEAIAELHPHHDIDTLPPRNRHKL